MPDDRRDPCRAVLEAVGYMLYGAAAASLGLFGTPQIQMLCLVVALGVLVYSAPCWRR